MYGPSFEAFPFVHTLGPLFWPVLGMLALWELIIKGFALWRAGRNGHSVWFVFLLILNTVGILPLVYLIWFSKPPAAPSSAAPEA